MAEDRIGLADAIKSLRDELLTAAAAAQGLHFPIENIALEFHVGVTKEVEGKAGAKFWVVELGGGASYSNEQIQKVTVTLGPPVDDEGRAFKVGRGYDAKP